MAKIVGLLKTGLPAGRCPALAPCPRKSLESGFPGCGEPVQVGDHRQRQACPRSLPPYTLPGGFPGSGPRPVWTGGGHREPAGAGNGQTWGGQAQQTVKIKLPGGGREQVRAPHHLRHAHAGIVHHHGQLVGKHAIGAAEVEIPAVAEQVLGVRAIQPSVKVMSSSGTMRR
mgnify:CR=1 FL=1